MLEKIRGLLLGEAVADALGVPVEFIGREELRANPVTTMRGFGTHNMPAGSWSDDTSMTIALMESLGRLGRLDYQDIMQNFLAWMDRGDFTPTGRLFDIGRATMQALMKFSQGTAPLLCGGRSEYDNGNGSLMRIAPLAPLLYQKYGTELGSSALMTVHEVSALTHAHARSQMACGIYIFIAVRLMAGEELKAAIAGGLAAAHDFYAGQADFADEMATYGRLWDMETFQVLPERAIHSSGYVVDTLAASLWCLLNFPSYEQSVLKAVNLGSDTDTTAAVTGALAGLYYGVPSIPAPWLTALLRRDYLEELSKKFAASLAVG